MITRFHIENFKSLVNFTLPPDDPDVDSGLPPTGRELGGFTCLIGLNGSGKSTLLQAFDFIAHIATGKVKDWLGRRDWKKGELVSHFGKKTPVIIFTIGLRTTVGTVVEWTARFNTTSLKCTAETITSAGKDILKLEEGRLTVAGAPGVPEQRYEKVPWEYEGAVMSSLKMVDADPGIAEMKTALAHLCSLELLSPQLMRRKARAAQDIGAGGEKLSPFLDQLQSTAKTNLYALLCPFYPQLETWNVRGYRAGWKSLRIKESYPDSGMIETGHINDGFLRVIAILAQAQSPHQFLLFDEIENGINPALVEKLMDFLVGLGQQGKQVVVTTHSPMILNFLDDQVARDSVILLYKTPAGKTLSCRYFDQPETSQKLKALGPGEVFVDTDLTKLVERLSGSASPAVTKEEV
jgi:predicted ATPase